MSLRKLEIYGFKSFADKLEMHFDKGITGIVGPNGCGKSNVSDAIRWALGEQSARTMRGKGMQDLIFAGTQQRKSMSYCEVSLYFDNSQRLFPLDFDEVVISRKLYRSGESEYLLNRNTSRLKDITDLLREAGLGREGYSIVGQGRMDAILSSKPVDRRAIFEEALGISKFRARKEETERKLERTAENLMRIEDILREVERQLNPLKRQAEDAKKYLQITEQLKYHEINAYIYNYDNASVNKAKINKLIDGIKEEHGFNSLKFGEAFMLYEQLLKEIDDQDNRIKALQEDELELSLKIERQTGDQKVNMERVRFFKERVGTLSEETKLNIRTIEESGGRAEFLKKEIVKKRAGHEELTNQLVLINDKFSSLTRKINDLQEEADDSQAKVVELLDGLSEHKSQNASLDSEKHALIKRLQEIDGEENQIAEKLRGLSSDEQALLRQYESTKANREFLQQETAKAKEALKAIEPKLFELNSKAQKVSESSNVDSARLRMLKQFIENFEGFGTTVKLLLKDAQNNKNLSDKICGVVANLIKVPEKLEVAIETALGGALQNLVTYNEDGTKDLINYLKDNRLGRITFLPITSMKPRRLENLQVLREAGVLGVGSNLISFDSKYTNVISSLLGSTVVVDNMDNAIKIARKYSYAFRIVTLDGDMLQTQGSISGGSKKVETGGVLSYDREATQLQERLDSSNNELSALSENIKVLQDKKKNIEEIISKHQQSLQEAIVEQVKIEEKLSKSEILNNNEREFVAKLSKQREAIGLRIKEIDGFLSGAGSMIDSLSSERSNVTDGVSKLQSRLGELKRQRDGLSDEITACRLKIAGIVNSIAADEKEIGEISALMARLSEENKQKAAMQQEYHSSIEAIESEVFRSASSDKDINRLKTIKEEIQNSAEQKRICREKMSKADKDRQDYTAILQRLSEEKLREENNLDRIDRDIEQMQIHIEEQYGLSYSAAYMYKDENYDYSTSKKEITKLTNQKNALGVVNVNAIDEVIELQQRCDSMTNDVTDLKKAEADIKEIIHNLTVEIESRFSAGFQQINNNFSVVFKELFAGGSARLSLEEDDSGEALNYGIEIEAQPPGKRLQSIALLSGGERALTAAAILFAILKLRPMPFCVLDEIEAALDDANADRIAKYLHKFSDDTQFIVITHKKPTMEKADVLYGVTMEEMGVSKTVSVRLIDALKHVQE